MYPAQFESQRANFTFHIEILGMHVIYLQFCFYQVGLMIGQKTLLAEQQSLVKKRSVMKLLLKHAIYSFTKYASKV